MSTARMEPAARQHDHAQLVLEGFGEIYATVTTYAGEGGYMAKRIYQATETDLIVDAQIHDADVAKAIAAQRRAIMRNEALLPIMEEHGFLTAGEAIEWLDAHIEKLIAAGPDALSSWVCSSTTNRPRGEVR